MSVRGVLWSKLSGSWMTAWLIPLCFLSALPGTSAAGEALADLERAYAGIRDVSGTFVQTSVLPELDRREQARGYFTIILPDLIRWDYTAPRRQKTLVDKTAVFIQQEEGDIMTGRFDEAQFGMSPLTLLAGPARFKEAFHVAEPRRGTIELKPRSPQARVRLVRLTLDGEASFPVKEIYVLDMYGNENTFVFADIKVNGGLRADDLRLGLDQGK